MKFWGVFGIATYIFIAIMLGFGFILSFYAICMLVGMTESPRPRVFPWTLYQNPKQHPHVVYKAKDIEKGDSASGKVNSGYRDGDQDETMISLETFNEIMKAMNCDTLKIYKEMFKKNIKEKFNVYLRGRGGEEKEEEEEDKSEL